VQQRGLAGAARAGHGEDLAGTGGEVRTLQRGRLPERQDGVPRFYEEAFV
jgi:hypothetical protein